MNELVSENDHVGPYNIQDLGLILAAKSGPAIDPLIHAYRFAKEQYAADTKRVAKLPHPALGDPHHHMLEREYNYARAQLIKFLLANRDYILINGN